MNLRRALVASVGCLIAAGAVVLVGAAPASAHASLVSSTPSARSVVAQAPTQVRLEFSEPVETAAVAVSVVGPDGQSLPTTAPAAMRDNAAIVVTDLPASLSPGTYVVTWRMLSTDGHAVRGEFRFAYTRATTTLAPASGSSSSAVSPLAWSGRALAASGALALVGLVSFPLLLMAPASRQLPEDFGRALARAAGPRLNRLVVVAAGIAGVGTLIVVFDTVAKTSGVAAGALLGRPHLLIDFVSGTRTGMLLSARIAILLVMVVLFLRAQRTRRRTLASGVTCGLALLTLFTFSLSSHSATAVVDKPLAVGFDVLHLVAAGLWIGGLLALALVGLPATQDAGKSRSQVAASAAALTGRFSVIAQIAMLAVLSTGGYLALLQVSALRQLSDSAWGVALTVKIALWLTLLIFASVNAIRFVPRLAERAASAQRRSAAAGNLRSTIRLELLIAGGLVVAAAFLSASPTPSSTDTSLAFAAGTPDVRRSTSNGNAEGYSARVTISRIGDGESAATVFRVAVTTEGTPASAPAADGLLRYPDGATRAFALQPSSAGEWVSGRLSVKPGRYLVTANVRRVGTTVSIPVNVKVPS